MGKCWLASIFLSVFLEHGLVERVARSLALKLGTFIPVWCEFVIAGRVLW